MHYFYEEQLVPTTSETTLAEQESKHALKVLRMQVGQAISLLDGKGGLYEGVISAAVGKKCQVNIHSYTKQAPTRTHRIHIAIAPTKNMDRTEWFVEKAVELGVDAISFILTRYSERKVLKMDRIYKTAVAAMKQSGNFYLPQFQELTKFETFLGTVLEPHKFMAYVPADPTNTLFKSAIQGNTCVLVGPEGGFSEAEVQLAQQHGFKAVSLGKRRLRTETAGIAACHLLNLKMEV
ncbi:MAG: 16S rRNA (uracil(1498)-N(3))-methyltransferase [Flammeovirgaceae bacterium]